MALVLTVVVAAVAAAAERHEVANQVIGFVRVAATCSSRGTQNVVNAVLLHQVAVAEKKESLKESRASVEVVDARRCDQAIGSAKSVEIMCLRAMRIAESAALLSQTRGRRLWRSRQRFPEEKAKALGNR